MNRPVLVDYGGAAQQVMRAVEAGFRLARIGAAWRTGYCVLWGVLTGLTLAGTINPFGYLIAVLASLAAGAFSYWREGRKQP